MPVNPNLGTPVAGPLREVSKFLVDTTPGQEQLYAPFNIPRPNAYYLNETVIPTISQLNEPLDESPAARLEGANFSLQNDQSRLWRSRDHDILARVNDNNKLQTYVATRYLPKYQPAVFDPKQLDFLDVRPVRATSIIVPPGEGIRVKNDWTEFSLEHNKPNSPQEAVMTNEPTLEQLGVSFGDTVTGGIHVALEAMRMTPHEILESVHLIKFEGRYRLPLFYIRRLAEIGIVDQIIASNEDNDALNRVLLGSRSYRVDLLHLAGDFADGNPSPRFRVFDAQTVSASDVSLLKTIAEQPNPLITFYGRNNSPADDQYRKKSEATFLR